jgi:hypothetical protein
VDVVHDHGQRLDSAEDLEGTAEVAEELLRRALQLAQSEHTGQAAAQPGLFGVQ